MDNLYLVSGGDVTLLDAPPTVCPVCDDADCQDHDGVEYIIALAPDEVAALRLAENYDAGRVGYDNHIYRGATVAAVA